MPAQGELTDGELPPPLLPELTPPLKLPRLPDIDARTSDIECAGVLLDGSEAIRPRLLLIESAADDPGAVVGASDPLLICPRFPDILASISATEGILTCPDGVDRMNPRLVLIEAAAALCPGDPALDPLPYPPITPAPVLLNWLAAALIAAWALLWSAAAIPSIATRATNIQIILMFVSP